VFLPKVDCTFWVQPFFATRGMTQKMWLSSSRVSKGFFFWVSCLLGIDFILGGGVYVEVLFSPALLTILVFVVD